VREVEAISINMNMMSYVAIISIDVNIVGSFFTWECSAGLLGESVGLKRKWGRGSAGRAAGPL